MKQRILSVLNIFFGVILLLIGLVGNVLPVIPGLLFMAAGLLVLSSEIPQIHRWLDRLENRYPKVRSALSHLRDSNGKLKLQKLALMLIVVSLVVALIGYLFYRAV